MHAPRPCREKVVAFPNLSALITRIQCLFFHANVTHLHTQNKAFLLFTQYFGKKRPLWPKDYPLLSVLYCCWLCHTAHTEIGVKGKVTPHKCHWPYHKQSTCFCLIICDSNYTVLPERRRHLTKPPNPSSCWKKSQLQTLNYLGIILNRTPSMIYQSHK